MIEGQVTFEVRALLTSQSFHDLDTSPIVHYWKAAGSRPDNPKFQEKQPNFTLCFIDSNSVQESSSTFIVFYHHSKYPDSNSIY